MVSVFINVRQGSPHPNDCRAWVKKFSKFREMGLVICGVVFMLIIMPKKAYADDLQMTVQNYIAFCNGGNSNTCYEDIASYIGNDIVAAQVSTGYPDCVPDERDTNFDAIVGSALLGWIENHPELANETAEDALSSAEDAIYPCLTPP